MADLIAPIPGEHPAGQPARYAPAWQRLEAELAKLGAPGAGPVDWAAAERDAEEVLTRLSKDLLAACWLVRARFQRQGGGALAPALDDLRTFIGTWWEAAQPPAARPRARRQALAWLAEGLAPLVQADGGALAAAERLAHELASRCEDGAACLAPLLRALRPASTVTAAPAATPAAATSPPAIHGRDEAVARLREAASWFRRAEPHSPVAFLAERAAAWAEKDFPSLMAELLANHQPAQAELWQVLGLRTPETSP